MIRDQQNGQALTEQLLFLFILEHVLNMAGVIIPNWVIFLAIQYVNYVQTEESATNQSRCTTRHQTTYIMMQTDSDLFSSFAHQNSRIGPDLRDYLPRPQCDYSHRLSAESTETRMPYIAVHHSSSLYSVHGRGGYLMKV